MENWIKVVVTLDVLDPTTIDLLSHTLFDAGAIGVEVDYAQGYLENHPNLFGELAEPLPKERLEHPTEIIAYFEEEQDVEALEARLRLLVADEPFSVTQTIIPNENWQENWMQHYHPQRISRYLTIVPVWEDYQAQTDEHCIYLDPGLAFGTGNHPTTQLGVQALEMYLRGGEKVLDVGTGSGVLAFVAAMYGASQVWGYDLDPQAVESAKQNHVYQLERGWADKFEACPIEFSVNDLLKGVTHQVDVIVANILPHILVNMFDDARKLLNDDGYMILGGILAEKAAELEADLIVHEWRIIQKNQLNGWVGYVVQKQEKA
ncbi:MAG: 50S ribosomal protein L11 methyltransferase [Aerococcaceae bacterium]|nr:50S ribosomal protein L11 methyltransferase [Aerococcaceae bacterium]